MKHSASILLVLLITAIAPHVPLKAQNPPKREYRGAWVATVANLDWPLSGNVPVQYQKDDLIQKLDRLKENGINLVFFQIRTEGDALYASEIEPWSYYLTGKEGRAPNPYWDPLAFAIEEAHKRGMELHAWLNPYRAMRSIPSDFVQKGVAGGEDAEAAGQLNPDAWASLEPFLLREEDMGSGAGSGDGGDVQAKSVGTSQRDSMHVSNKHPEWLLVLNRAIAIFDPGLPEVMEYTTAVVMDVVNRYDVDGIHFDDYFYPYPPNHMASSSANNALDDSTFIKYPRGFTNKAEWRRNNVDLLVEMIHDSIQVIKPWVKFGISPFGIWKSGTPSGISGLDAYSQIYGDGIAWLDAGTVDYILPQLYWAFGGGQDYAKLSNWWADQAVARGRHMIAGHGLYRASSSTFSGALFKANEVPRQVRHNRGNPKISGSVFFRAKNLTNFPTLGFTDSLKTDLYRHAALPPVMAWKDTSRFEAPSGLTVERDPENRFQFTLSWTAPTVDGASRTSDGGHVDSLVKYAIYRVDSSVSESFGLGGEPDPLQEMAHARNLVAVTGQTDFTDVVPYTEGEYWYFVTAVTRNNVESEPTDPVEGGFVTSTHGIADGSVGRAGGELPNGFTLLQNAPNPFNPSTSIAFVLAEAGDVRLTVHDLLGREVAVLAQGRYGAGRHTLGFDASSLTSGVYSYVLQTDRGRMVRSMTLVK